MIFIHLIYDVLSAPVKYFQLICRRSYCNVIAASKLLESDVGTSALSLLIIHPDQWGSLNYSESIGHFIYWKAFKVYFFCM